MMLFGQLLVSSPTFRENVKNASKGLAGDSTIEVNIHDTTTAYEDVPGALGTANKELDPSGNNNRSIINLYPRSGALNETNLEHVLVHEFQHLSLQGHAMMQHDDPLFDDEIEDIEHEHEMFMTPYDPDQAGDHTDETASGDSSSTGGGSGGGGGDDSTGGGSGGDGSGGGNGAAEAATEGTEEGDSGQQPTTPTSRENDQLAQNDYSKVEGLGNVNNMLSTTVEIMIDGELVKLTLSEIFASVLGFITAGDFEAAFDLIQQLYGTLISSISEDDSKATTMNAGEFMMSLLGHVSKNLDTTESTEETLFTNLQGFIGFISGLLPDEPSTGSDDSEPDSTTMMLELLISSFESFAAPESAPEGELDSTEEKPDDVNTPT